MKWNEDSSWLAGETAATLPTTMRAARYDRYGPPDVLYEGCAPVPAAASGQVLVGVAAASVNGGELWARAGALRWLLRGGFPKGSGFDFAGEVVALGAGTTGFAVGDRVWGSLPRGEIGSAAEFVAVPASKIAPAPVGLDLVAAASLPAGTTALTALRDQVGLAPGDRLLVRGANGGVGSVAVQLGRAMDAHVTALANVATLDLVRDLGAHHALDHRSVRPTDLGTFDVVLDTVGTELHAFHRLLAPTGRMVAITIRSIGAALTIAASSALGRRRIRFFSGNPATAHFADLTRYVEDGAVRPVVDTVHPLADIAAAHRALEAGGVRGKHVVRITTAADTPGARS